MRENDRDYVPLPSRAVEPFAAVEYLRPDDDEVQLYQGHVGRVCLTDLWPHEIIVSFINGPSIGLSPEDVALVDAATFEERGKRLVAGQHPLEDRPIPMLIIEDEEWNGLRRGDG